MDQRHTTVSQDLTVMSGDFIVSERWQNIHKMEKIINPISILKQSFSKQQNRSEKRKREKSKERMNTESVAIEKGDPGDTDQEEAHG